ncbi:AraC family transcriptional regulator [bacterium]|nr:MAG: AraC family transcriptional regulator [bacterium]
MNDVLDIEGPLPFDALGAGVMISRGAGRHIERVAAHFTLLFVRQGTLYIEEEGNQIELHEGHTLVLWPGRHHQGTKDYDENLQFYWLHFVMEPHREGSAKLHIPQLAKLARPDFVTELFRRYLDDQGSGDIKPLSAALYTWMILREVATQYANSEERTKAALAGRVDTYIRIHHHERISVSDVAKAIGYNSQYLCRIYRQTYNSSLAGAIRRIRINHAKWLLMETDHSIGKISQLTGFEDTSYFQRVFKQLEGITPSQFRRLHARMNVVYQ